jgi:hypothetical protein
MPTPTQIEMSKSVLTNADGLTQWAFLINGAAAAGLLTFLGNAVKNRSDFANWEGFSTAILCFGIGLMLAVMARFFTFVALTFLAHATDRTGAQNIEDLAIYLIIGDRGTICAITSFICFLGACIAFLVGVLFGRHAVFG